MKYEVGKEVILLDPISGKPVNYGRIESQNEADKTYGVTIIRLKNYFPLLWHEELLLESTPQLYEQVENNLAQVEIVSDLLVSYIDSKHKTKDNVLEFPVVINPYMPKDKIIINYIVYYKKMDIDGQQLWRLLTFKEFRIPIAPLL